MATTIHPDITPKKRGRTIYQHTCSECGNPFPSRDAGARTCGMFCAIEAAQKKQQLKAKTMGAQA